MFTKLRVSYFFLGTIRNVPKGKFRLAQPSPTSKILVFDYIPTGTSKLMSGFHVFQEKRQVEYGEMICSKTEFAC